MISSKSNFMKWESPGWAVITGASSGIGEEFARQLGAQGFSLFLVARRKDRLEELAKSLHGAYGVTAETFPANLGHLGEIDRVRERLQTLENLDVLINNAGFTTVGPFFETDLKSQLSMLNVHNATPVILTRIVLPKMIQRNRGVIIFTASLAAFLPSPGAGLYTPTKAFLMCLAKILSLELNHTQVRVQALCPGYTRTEFHNDPAFNGLKALLPKFVWGTSQRVVRNSLQAALKRKCVVVPGLLNRLEINLIPKKIMLKSFMKNRWEKVRRHESPQKIK